MLLDITLQARKAGTHTNHPDHTGATTTTYLPTAAIRHPQARRLLPRCVPASCRELSHFSSDDFHFHLHQVEELILAMRIAAKLTVLNATVDLPVTFRAAGADVQVHLEFQNKVRFDQHWRS